jgi:hypothetical protein
VASSKQLHVYGVYCLAQSPHQYVVHPTGHPGLSWLLMPSPDHTVPEYAGPSPLLYVTEDGRIGRQEGMTALDVGDLLFTGRSLHNGHTFCTAECRIEKGEADS